MVMLYQEVAQHFVLVQKFTDCVWEYMELEELYYSQFASLLKKARACPLTAARWQPSSMVLMERLQKALRDLHKAWREKKGITEDEVGLFI